MLGIGINFRSKPAGHYSEKRLGKNIKSTGASASPEERNMSRKRKNRERGAGAENSGNEEFDEALFQSKLDQAIEEIEEFTPLKKRKQRISAVQHQRMAKLELDDDSDFEKDGGDKKWGRKAETSETAELASALDTEKGHGPMKGTAGHDIPWLEKYLPNDVKDLGGNKKKLGLVRDWLSVALKSERSEAPMCLILTGPSGSGKSTIIRVLAEEMQLELVEWGGQGKSLHDFEVFLKEMKYPSLVNASRERVVLVDDLPVIEGHRRMELQNLLMNTAAFIQSPIVIALTNSGHGVPSIRRMLGQELLTSVHTYRIQFKAVTNADIKKRLKCIMRNEKLSVPAHGLDSIVESCGGDMRSAIMSLQIYCTSNEGAFRENRFKETPKRRRRDGMSNSTSFVGKDVALETVHAVSKILNNKRLGCGSSKYDVESILADSTVESSTFILFLHQNYAPFFSDTDDIAEALDCLSLSDTLLPWQQSRLSFSMLQECASSLACRGCLYYNRHPIQNRWRPVHAPEAFSVNSACAEYVEQARCKILLRGYSGADLRTMTLMSELYPFLPLISESKKKSVTFQTESKAVPSHTCSQEVQLHNGLRLNAVGKNSRAEFETLSILRTRGEDHLSQFSLMNEMEGVAADSEASELQGDAIMDWDEDEAPVFRVWNEKKDWQL